MLQSLRRCDALVTAGNGTLVVAGIDAAVTAGGCPCGPVCAMRLLPGCATATVS